MRFSTIVHASVIVTALIVVFITIFCFTALPSHYFIGDISIIVSVLSTWSAYVLFKRKTFGVLGILVGIALVVFVFRFDIMILGAKTRKYYVEKSLSISAMVSPVFSLKDSPVQSEDEVFYHAESGSGLSYHHIRQKTSLEVFNWASGSDVVPFVTVYFERSGYVSFVRILIGSWFKQYYGYVVAKTDGSVLNTDDYAKVCFLGDGVWFVVMRYDE